MKKEKQRNKTLNYFSLGLFNTDLVAIFIVSISLSLEYKANQDLLKQKEKLQEELDYIKDIDANVQDGYYVVYAEGEYALDMHGEVIVIYNCSHNSGELSSLTIISI